MARRFRQLVTALANDLGGEATLGTAEMALLRQAAIVTLQCERLQAALLNGETVENNELVRTTNAATRILVALGIQKRKRQPAHTPLRERLRKGN
jgi:trimethylamine:corrinoid methyltransferase-like protein